MTWFGDLFRRKWQSQLSPSKILICEQVLVETEELLLGDEDDPTELVAYWLGVEGATWAITTCIIPSARVRRGGFQTSSASNARVVTYAAERSLKVLAQVHTHPGKIIDHSELDAELAFMPFENYLSIVVPNYGRDGVWPMTKCGIHRYGGGQFTRLSSEDVARLFEKAPASQNFRKE